MGTRNILYSKYLKRCFDLALTISGVILFSPIFGIVALLVRFKLGGPVLFRQQRPGLKGRPFTIYKFRTMTDARDENGHLLPNAQRLTRLGRFLRSTSSDELPELFNVLKGDMSLVGPRPLQMEYLPLYSQEQNRRHDVKPGITGLAQIAGRNSITWEEKFKFDVWYVDNISLLLDMKIIFQTFFAVFKREGINASDTITMPKFQGTQK